MTKSVLTIQPLIEIALFFMQKYFVLSSNLISRRQLRFEVLKNIVFHQMWNCYFKRNGVIGIVPFSKLSDISDINCKLKKKTLKKN